MTEIATTPRPPTERQLDVLRAIDTSISEQGFPPTLKELCGQLGTLSTNGMAEHLDALVKQGLVSRKAYVSRGLRITEAGRAALDAAQPESRST